MQLTEGIKFSIEDRKELERNIKNLEKEIEKNNEGRHPKIAPENDIKIKELRRLRRMRQTEEE